MDSEFPRLDFLKTCSGRPVKDRPRDIMDVDAEIERRVPFDDPVASAQSCFEVPEIETFIDLSPASEFPIRGTNALSVMFDHE